MTDARGADVDEAPDRDVDETGESIAADPADRARHVWSIGSYDPIATQFLPMAAHLVRAGGVEAGDRVLDVACGTGNVAITAGRRGALVTGLDITPAMLAAARENAAVAGLSDVDWCEGDAADLPFPDDAFDATLSCVGHVFSERPDAAAAELLRVTRPGGRVAFTAWTPESVVPAMGAAVGEYLPPDPDPSPPPAAWGDPNVVRERLGDGVDDVEFETGTVSYRVASPAHYWAGATEESGMFIVALSAVDEADLPALRRDVVEAVDRYFDDRVNAVRMEYLVTTATVR